MTIQKIAEAFGVDPATLVAEQKAAGIEPVAIVGELSEPTRSEVIAKGHPIGRYLYAYPTSEHVTELHKWRAIGARLLSLLRAKGYDGTLEDQLSGMLGE